MRKIRNILLLGAGAVGVLPAAGLLRLNEVDLKVLAQGERLERYRKEGIFFNGEKLPFRFLGPGEEKFHADLVIVATKTWALDDALPLLAEFVDAQTWILPLLNGISARSAILSCYPECTVFYGLFLGHASSRQGNRITHDGTGRIYFGNAFNREPNASVMALSALFGAADVEAEVPENMIPILWKKFILNVGINQTQAYFQADYGDVQKHPEMMDFCMDLMSEGVAVARREGVSGLDTAIQEAVRVIMQMPPDAQTSMLQDLRAGRPTEVAAFAGEICLRARGLALPVPANEKVLKKLQSCSGFSR